ncbi:nuclear transport factor 2 family protein [Actinomadura parmotrematis]|uniref:Nuclear transport factor 2 family protein n=1 Tax=Actinomadura parmotrematis TaxID=2864039 RepID=A0ABS7FY64_9ACTN|nr:nuclear transport factor 2 family protein [Actinomadura parmotrematis]MBW8485374.1 nuclear transport factor 2 family protein [Actinomadura parmotrematis]
MTTPSDPAVRALVAAINAGDRDAFLAVLTPDATLSDDGTDRDLGDWIDREIFDAHGRFALLGERADGLALTARFRNDTWGEMRTAWRFTRSGDKISRIETGQA